MSRAVLVTGGSRGIGAAIVRGFAERGDRVALHCRDGVAAAEAVRDSLPGQGHVIVRADLTDPEEVRAMVDEAAGQLGGLDVLVNNAGVYGGVPVLGTSYAEWQAAWQATIGLNLTGAANVTWCAVRHMIGDADAGGAIGAGRAGGVDGAGEANKSDGADEAGGAGRLGGSSDAGGAGSAGCPGGSSDAGGAGSAGRLGGSSDAGGAGSAGRLGGPRGAGGAGGAGRTSGSGGGRIVNVGSRGAYRGEPAHPAYGASKAGLHAFGQSLAVALAPHGITVASVAPGYVATDMTAEELATPAGDVIRAQSPFGRVATPREVAAAVVFLASPEAAWSSGAVLDLNGASYLR